MSPASPGGSAAGWRAATPGQATPRDTRATFMTLYRFIVFFGKAEEGPVGAVGNAFVSVFQGAVDAFCASTAPAASIGRGIEEHCASSAASSRVPFMTCAGSAS